MWDVFPDDMGLDSNTELALANLDLHDPVLESVTFDDSDPLEGSSSTPIDIDPQMGGKGSSSTPTDIDPQMGGDEEEEEEESNDVFVDPGMEEDY